MPGRDIESIYKDCSRMVYWAAYGITRRESDAMDAMQNTFLRAIAHMEQLARMNDAQLRGWLYRVTVNLCKDSLRKQSRETLTEEPLEPKGENVYDLPEAALVSSEEKALVRHAIDQLPDIYRETVLLHYFSGCDYKQIAQLTGTTEGNVKSRMSRAKRQLYGILKKGGENDGGPNG
ncbi:MAG: RNA polymerase sigma factor [Candidatus Pelethousia sp.]|nr:RNA polymerase sigma factor [Candidatus Pelethousia sp.]